MPLTFVRKATKEEKEAKEAQKKAEKETKEAREAKKKADEEREIYAVVKPYLTGDKIDVDKALDAGVSESVLLKAGVSNTDIKFYRESKKLERASKREELKTKEQERKLHRVEAKTKLARAQTSERKAKASRSKARRERIESTYSVARALVGGVRGGAPKRKKKKKKKKTGLSDLEKFQRSFD